MWRTIVIRNVITCPGRQGQCSTILVLDYHLTRDHVRQVAFVTPMIADIRRAVLHNAKLYLPELPSAHSGGPRLARMLRWWHGRPVS